MKTQITEQSNGLLSVYSDGGPDVSMSDETLLGFDLTEEQAEKLAASAQH